MSYKHLSLEERNYIEIETKKGTSQSDIAKALGRGKSNISRELRRNIGLKGYRHKQANNFFQGRHKTKAKATKLTEEIIAIIEGYLREPANNNLPSLRANSYIPFTQRFRPINPFFIKFHLFWQ